MYTVYPKSPAPNCPHLPPTQGSIGTGEVSNSTSWRADQQRQLTLRKLGEKNLSHTFFIVLKVWCLSFIGHLKEILGRSISLSWWVHSTHLNKYARQKRVHLPQIGVIFFQKTWVATTFRTEFLICLGSPKTKSTRSMIWTNLRTPMVWTGCSWDRPKDIYRKLRFDWKIKISKPWDFRRKFQAENILYTFLKLVNRNQSCPVGNGKKRTKFTKPSGFLTPTTRSTSQDSLQKSSFIKA